MRIHIPMIHFQQEFPVSLIQPVKDLDREKLSILAGPEIIYAIDPTIQGQQGLNVPFQNKYPRFRSNCERSKMIEEWMLAGP